MFHKTSFLMFLILSIGLTSVSAQTETTAVRKISGGVLNGKATSLPVPAYPAAAKAVRASGAVNVQVTIDEQGNVASASAVSGHPLLRQAAEQAALGAKFAPTLLSGQPVSVTGVMVYNFVGATNWMDEGVRLGAAEQLGIKTASNFPVEFSSEQDQLKMLATLPVDQQKTQLPATVSTIKSKLNAADLWRFEFGLAKGRIVSNQQERNLRDDSTLATNLAKFKELSMNKTPGLMEAEINLAAELAKFADKGILSVEDKRTILIYLK